MVNCDIGRSHAKWARRERDSGTGPRLDGGLRPRGEDVCSEYSAIPRQILTDLPDVMADFVARIVQDVRSVGGW